MWRRITAGIKGLSLRRQQLVFFFVVTVFVLVIIATSVGMTARSAAVFGSNLNRYYHIHELRTALSAVHDRLELYFRTEDLSLLDAIGDDAGRVWDRYLRLTRIQIPDLSSRLELRATYYGLRAYESAARDAVALLSAGDEQAYLTLARADRIRGYVDMYLERLFQIQLEYGRLGYEQALVQQQTIRVLGISGIFLVGLALTTFALLFSRSVTSPLDRLVNEAHALASGEFDRPAMELPESRQLREVALAFNRMTNGIRELVANLKDQHELERKLHQQEISNMSMERLLREAQLVALQSQVNPHFLFNTLNSVARTARIEGADRSEKLIRGLASVLRYILRNPRQSVALVDELRIVEEYLSLQAVRFGERLSYRVSADEEIRETQIPPLILQPLVENAVIYGIEPKEAGGTIEVCVTSDGKRIAVTITDDGNGMPRETVKHLLRDGIETTGDNTSGIGVINVRARLELFFGEDQRFELASTPGAGTRIEITLPLQRTAERYGLHHIDR